MPGGGTVAPGRYGPMLGSTNRSNMAGLKYNPTTRATPRAVPDLFPHRRAPAGRWAGLLVILLGIPLHELSIPVGILGSS